ncbi:MAG: hypothetical protein CM15mP25_1840 [Gammaproteobacteria bacterium]|nr:MAG: hypothetical protein CM15mP25_1840 [Gammaproteobacteria bacterium]
MGRRRTLVVKSMTEPGCSPCGFSTFDRRRSHNSSKAQPYSCSAHLGGWAGKSKWCIPSTDWGGAQLLEAALTPVYPTVSGLGQSTWRKLCGQALALLSKEPPEDLLDGITDDRVSLTEAITFLHNPPPTAALSQIQEGTHPHKSGWPGRTHRASTDRAGRPGH